MLPSNHGNITSPNYPLNYGDGVNNRYLIVAPSGYVISFKFHLLELEDKDKNGGDTDVLKVSYCCTSPHHSVVPLNHTATSSAV